MKSAFILSLRGNLENDYLNKPLWASLVIIVTLFLGGLIFIFFSKPALVLAQGANSVVLTVRAGFDGKYKDGGWIPVHIVLENNGADLEGSIKVSFADGSGDPNIYEVPIELPSVSRKEVVMDIFSLGYSRTMEVTLTNGKQTVNKVKLQLDNFAASDLWYGIIASNPTTFNILAQLNTTNSTSRIIQLSLNDIPERTHIFGSIDVLVLSDVDTGRLADLQRQALVDWVAGGGRLILTGGPDWQKTVAGLLNTNLLPIQPLNTKVVPDLDNLQRYAHTSEPLSKVETGIIVTTGDPVKDAQILVEADSATPLIIRKRFGAGDVLYLAFDPGLPPLKSWDGKEAFFRSLLSNPLDKPSWLLGMRNWSQAKEAALTLPGLSLPSPLLICGFLALYILALGPVNYLLVRMLKRSELGWVTVPVMVLFFSGLIILIGSFTRGSRVVLNRLAVVQVWPDVPEARVDGVMGIYSPSRSTYRAEVNAPTLLHPFPVDFGTSANSYTIIETGVKTTISGLKLEISSIQPLAFEGSTTAPIFKHNLVMELGNQNASLKGSVTNTSDLSLTDAVLLYPGGTMRVGDLPPGKTFEVQEPLFKAQLAGEPNLNPTFPYATSYYGFPAPYSTPADTTVSDILGTSSYFDDRRLYRKYSLLGAITNNNFGTGSSRGSGIYLVGWSNHFPLEVNIPDTALNAQDNILYVITLRPTMQTNQQATPGQEITLTPGTFNWSLLEGYDPSITPYNINVSPGLTFTMQFTPILSIKYANVKSLEMHLEGQASGSKVNGIGISVWNYDLNAWEKLDDLRWGENNLDNPERYIGIDGSLRLYFTGGQVISMQITRLDFTMVLEK